LVTTKASSGRHFLSSLFPRKVKQTRDLSSVTPVPRSAGYTPYDRYDNYDAIEVGTYKEIPSDHDGVMGVPVTFLDKYNPDQFEILGYEKSYHLQTRKYGIQIQVDESGKKSKVTKLNDGAAIKVDRPPIDRTYYVVDGEHYIQEFKRIFIRHRAPTATGRKK